MRGLTKIQRINALLKNGITIEDLQENYREGYAKGFSDAAPATTKTIYAAVVLALHKTFGFGHERCRRALVAVDEEVLNSLTSEEAIQAAFDSVGLKLAFEEPFDRVQEVGNENMH